MMSPAREAHTRELAQHYAYKLYGPASSDVSPESRSRRPSASIWTQPKRCTTS